MKENKISIEINKPISEVFEFTINPKNTPSWINSIVREETNETPIKLGTKYKNLNKQGQWMEYEVVKFNLNKLFELKQKNGPYSVRYIYEPISKTRTKLTYFEWVNSGELEDPFSLTILGKLKKVIEEK